MKILDDRTMRTLETALDVASARHQVIANNIANVNTPGFKAADVDFVSSLEQAMAGRAEPTGPKLTGRATRVGHLPISGPASAGQLPVVQTVDEGASMRVDGNSVDIDLEMAKMAENATMYNTFAQLVSSKFSLLKYVISEGRR
ncbi:MAG TPA: flagellar basal body rod protein FlgB [Bacillota bacterium]|nr:flagellar basal body rod protein FlgB [Bacillota bacterium]